MVTGFPTHIAYSPFAVVAMFLCVVRLEELLIGTHLTAVLSLPYRVRAISAFAAWSMS
jgi:hypothetical protein